jgi:hypothetical protein
MTVADYIEELRKMKPTARCVISEHSEYVDARGPYDHSLIDRRGFLSERRAYEGTEAVIDVVVIS